MAASEIHGKDRQRGGAMAKYVDTLFAAADAKNGRYPAGPAAAGVAARQKDRRRRDPVGADAFGWRIADALERQAGPLIVAKPGIGVSSGITWRRGIGAGLQLGLRRGGHGSSGLRARGSLGHGLAFHPAPGIFPRKPPCQRGSGASRVGR